jgi:hypothetical protein
VSDGAEVSVAEPAIRGPEPCPVRGDYHRWAFLEREVGGITWTTGGAFAVQEPSRLVFYCQYCLVIRRWDELVRGGGDRG